MNIRAVAVDIGAQLGVGPPLAVLVEVQRHVWVLPQCAGRKRRIGEVKAKNCKANAVRVIDLPRSRLFVQVCDHIGELKAFPGARMCLKLLSTIVCQEQASGHKLNFPYPSPGKARQGSNQPEMERSMTEVQDLDSRNP